MTREHVLKFPTSIAYHPGWPRNGIICCCFLRTAYGARVQVTVPTVAIPIR